MDKSSPTIKFQINTVNIDTTTITFEATVEEERAVYVLIEDQKIRTVEKNLELCKELPFGRVITFQAALGMLAPSLTRRLGSEVFNPTFYNVW